MSLDREFMEEDDRSRKLAGASDLPEPDPADASETFTDTGLDELPTIVEPPAPATEDEEAVGLPDAPADAFEEPASPAFVTTGGVDVPVDPATDDDPESPAPVVDEEDGLVLSAADTRLALRLLDEDAAPPSALLELAARAREAQATLTPPEPQTVTEPEDIEPDVEPEPEPAVEPEVVEPVAAPVKQFRTFTLIDPNRLWVMVVAICLLAGILAASLVSSFTSVYAMAAWIGLPATVQWLPVVILDVAIVGYSWALLIFASRARDGRPTLFDGHALLPGQPRNPPDERAARKLRERTWTTRLWLSLVTAMSVVANFMHTFDFWNGDLSTPQAILGAVFSSAIPLMALVATEELIRLVFVRRKQVYGGGEA